MDRVELLLGGQVVRETHRVDPGANQGELGVARQVLHDADHGLGPGKIGDNALTRWRPFAGT